MFIYLHMPGHIETQCCTALWYQSKDARQLHKTTNAFKTILKSFFHYSDDQKDEKFVRWNLAHVMSVCFDARPTQRMLLSRSYVHSIVNSYELQHTLQDLFKKESNSYVILHKGKRKPIYKHEDIWETTNWLEFSNETFKHLLECLAYDKEHGSLISRPQTNVFSVPNCNINKIDDDNVRRNLAIAIKNTDLKHVNIDNMLVSTRSYRFYTENSNKKRTQHIKEGYTVELDIVSCYTNFADQMFSTNSKRVVSELSRSLVPFFPSMNGSLSNFIKVLMQRTAINAKRICSLPDPQDSSKYLSHKDVIQALNMVETLCPAYAEHRQIQAAAQCNMIAKEKAVDNSKKVYSWKHGTFTSNAYSRLEAIAMTKLKIELDRLKCGTFDCRYAFDGYKFQNKDRQFIEKNLQKLIKACGVELKMKTIIALD